jgi:hypothetical protein
VILPGVAVATSAQRESEQAAARTEVLREAVIMMLYVSIVEIAELASLPETHALRGRLVGPAESDLLAIIWGTAVGLAAAHWFAFRIAASGFRGQRPTRLDTWIGLAQVGAAAFVALLSSLPMLVASDVAARNSVAYIPATIIGVIGVLVARAGGRSWTRSIGYGVVALVGGIGVALLKQALSAH